MKKAKILLNSVNLCYIIQFTGFLLLNIMDQIFKISTIVETLVALRLAFEAFGLAYYICGRFLLAQVSHMPPSYFSTKYCSVTSFCFNRPTKEPKFVETTST